MRAQSLPRISGTGSRGVTMPQHFLRLESLFFLMNPGCSLNLCFRSLVQTKVREEKKPTWPEPSLAAAAAAVAALAFLTTAAAGS
jgi:hypothetical protein